jgi:hypothetical protein
MSLGRQLINHGYHTRQNRAAHSQAAALNFLATEGPLSGLALHSDFDYRTAENMIRCLNVSVGNAAEKAMLHEPALDFVPDPGKPGIELLSALIFFHGAPPHLAQLIT